MLVALPVLHPQLGPDQGRVVGRQEEPYHRYVEFYRRVSKQSKTPDVS
jgi:hypothetical protein